MRFFGLITGAFGVTAIALGIAFHASQEADLERAGRKSHLVLIGASIGQGWKLHDWPGRAKVNGFSAEALANWQFDKSEAVDEVLIRPRRKFRLGRTYFKSLLEAPPKKADIVILKECSAYFPGDLNQYKSKIKQWATELQGTGARVMLATVVPVTAVRAHQDPGKQESIREYNQWVREYAEERGYGVLDLDSALRANDGYLRPELAQSDGSHLREEAYIILDRLLKDTVCSTAKQPCDLAAQAK